MTFLDEDEDLCWGCGCCCCELLPSRLIGLDDDDRRLLLLLDAIAVWPTELLLVRLPLNSITWSGLGANKASISGVSHL